MVGSAVVSRLSVLNRLGAEPEGLFGTTSAELDITDPSAVRRALAEQRPDVIINCAAFTNVDKAELDPGLAYRVNAEGPGNLAAACAERGCRLVHISTDYVFDGLKGAPYVETDEANPLNHYGEGKLAGERLVAERMSNWVTVRTTWVFGPGRPDFVDWALGRAREAGGLELVADQWACPTYSLHLAHALWRVARSDFTGLLHVTGEGACNRLEQIGFAVQALGLDAEMTPIPTAKLARPANRPTDARLDNSLFRERFGCCAPTWRLGLLDYLTRFFREGGQC